MMTIVVELAEIAYDTDIGNPDMVEDGEEKVERASMVHYVLVDHWEEVSPAVPDAKSAGGSS